MQVFAHFIVIFSLLGRSVARSGPSSTGQVQEFNTHNYIQTCLVKSEGDGSDDSDNLTAAFKKCKKDGVIQFPNTTYHINKALRFDDLHNVKIEIKGTLKWSNDIDYWLNNSLPIGPGKDQNSYPPASYQNQSAAFILGGSQLLVDGFEYGTFDGNGQVWYDFVKGESNYPKRPHALVITAIDSTFRGLRFIQPQMWTVTIVSSKNILLENIYVKAKSTSGQPARNTDGANTLFSDSITFRGWEVENGDDCIATKANSTNILIEDAIFHNGQGVAIGSIGQYNGHYEIIENVVVRNITMYGSTYAARIKTWVGEQDGYPPNGGGGGIGHARNIVFQNITVVEGDGLPLVINQCYTLNGGSAKNCSTSTFDISDVSYRSLSGSIESSTIAKFQCSRSQAGCDGLSFDNVRFINTGTGEAATRVSCSNVIDPKGFECN